MNTAFTRSSDALVSRVVLLSLNVKTAHKCYYKDLREIIFHAWCRWWCFLRPFCRNKDKYLNRSLRHGTVLIRFGTYCLHRYRCHIGSRFWYPTLKVNVIVFITGRKCITTRLYFMFESFDLYCNNTNKMLHWYIDFILNKGNIFRTTFSVASFMFGLDFMPTVRD